jgi:hypothetical protein
VGEARPVDATSPVWEAASIQESSHDGADLFADVPSEKQVKPLFRMMGSGGEEEEE